MEGAELPELWSHRCRWANPQNERYLQYHDEEWGVPVYEDQKLFEMLVLESFQAGLSWECVLNKQEAFRKAFDGFDLEIVCGYGKEKMEELKRNSGIIRNGRKIQAAVENARIFRKIQEEYGSFSNYLWHWTDGAVIYEKGCSRSELSDTISGDLKKRGMKFVGTTIIYAYLQAVGVIYSHEAGCYLEYKKQG
ncbi:DNA-3-methyladenine glycosylase I [Merdimonas faecis]|uniref:DNA-3-methyladenine glycosylase I n=1 Tax=Merdimonas faecis TaxID=1653435 RepID=UPI0008635F71|nr:DNA-3-methyladenine glycosylase I [Merdimonas faecis]